jgi:ferredoxin
VSACTDCGHCVDACPTAALVPQQLSTGERRALPGRALQLAEARRQQRWHNQGEPPP